MGMSVWNRALIIVDGWLAGGGTLLTDSVTHQAAGSPFPSLSRISSSAAGFWLGVKLEWWENHRNAKGQKLIGKAKVSAVRGRSREHLHAIASASDHLNKQTVQNQSKNPTWTWTCRSFPSAKARDACLCKTTSICLRITQANFCWPTVRLSMPNLSGSPVKWEWRIKS